MAVIWQTRAEGKTFQLRQAGGSLRLYTDGVFHTQWNPQRPLAGAVWDLLTLPMLHLPPENVQRVLVLGVGGGAVIRQLQTLCSPTAITGVELSPTHLQLARDHFGCDGPEVTLVEGDAIEWMKQYSGRPFDVIVEDIFCERDGFPERVIEADLTWVKTLCQHLTRKGALVMNFVSEAECRRSAAFSAPSLKRQFCARWRFSLPGYENQIGAFFRSKPSAEQYQQCLMQAYYQHPAMRRSKLDYQIQTDA